MGIGIVALIVVLGIIAGVVVLIQRAVSKRSSDSVPSDGNDVVAYLILALAVGVAGFALARLAASAFPARGLVFDPGRELAASLPALIVSMPIAIFFWRRQSRRRGQYPGSVGWGIYLALIESVFGIAFVVAAVSYLTDLFGPGVGEWTQPVVFGGILVAHELAVSRTPPSGASGELYRVAGAAIGFITMVIGLVGFLGDGVLTALFDAASEDFRFDAEWLPWIPMAIVGAPIWVYRWYRPWSEDQGTPRKVWLAGATVSTFWLGVIGVTGGLALEAQDVFAGERFGGTAPAMLPIFIAMIPVGFGLWLIHRREMGGDRTNLVRFYEYALAALGLMSAISSAVILVNIAFGARTLVGGGSSDVIQVGFALIVGLWVWGWFHSRQAGHSRELEALAWPRRLYLIGMGAVLGITAAVGLIFTLVVIVQRIVGSDDNSSLLLPASIFVITAAVAWYLIVLYQRDQEFSESGVSAGPFKVTIVTSHPGPISTLFPDNARLEVIYRADDSGAISDEMAESIVEEVGDEASVVWVDDDGYRITRTRID